MATTMQAPPVLGRKDTYWFGSSGWREERDAQAAAVFSPSVAREELRAVAMGYDPADTGGPAQALRLVALHRASDAEAVAEALLEHTGRLGGRLAGLLGEHGELAHLHAWACAPELLGARRLAQGFAARNRVLRAARTRRLELEGCDGVLELHELAVLDRRIALLEGALRLRAEQDSAARIGGAS